MKDKLENGEPIGFMVVATEVDVNGLRTRRESELIVDYDEAVRAVEETAQRYMSGGYSEKESE